jgi:EAL domain-containing protein (putative c-di-GMP-specific phosphodiesterase class I)
MNALKIDRSFVADLDDDGESTAIVRTIVTLAHSLGLEAIAEGVETEAQRDRLLSFNCDLAQGYFLARPAPANAVPALLVRY